MKIVTNQKLIQRNRKFGQILSIASLVVLGIGMYMSFQQALISYSFLMLIIGFMVSQVGIYYGNRWGRSPRPDEVITAALKGLDDRYTLYHYIAPTAHLLVGPAGVWALLPFQQKGKISYEKGRWKQRGGSIYLKIFAQEGLGRPDAEIKAALEDMQRFYTKNLEGTSLPTQAALVFTNPKVELETADAPAVAVRADKLKDFIRKNAKEGSKVMTPDVVKQLTTALPEYDVEVIKGDVK